MVRRAARPRVRGTKGAIVALYEARPAGGAIVCLDAPGPEAVKRVPGRRVVRPDPTGERRPRAAQEPDSGRCGSGDVFGAFLPATGEAPTAPYRRRTIASVVAFPGRVGARLGPAAARVDAVLDNRSARRARDVLRWARARPRRECVFRPTSAADSNLIAPWGKILRALAVKGRRFGSPVGATSSRPRQVRRVSAAPAFGRPQSWQRGMQTEMPQHGASTHSLP